MLIRTLTVFERCAVRDFHLALSADDRRKRFCSTVSDDAISRYVDGLDFSRHTIIGAFDEHDQVIGLAELAFGAEESEMAFAVRPESRCGGIGAALMERLLLRTRMCGKRKVMVMFLADNAPMRRLAARAGMPVKTEGGVAFASRELSAPSAEEFNQWFIEEAIAHSAYFSVLELERREALVNRSHSTAAQGRHAQDAPTA